MLVTHINLHPGGDPRHPRRLAALHIGNVTRRDGEAADGDSYLWHLREPRSPFSGGLDRTGILRGWDRMQPAAALVAAVMQQAVDPLWEPATLTPRLQDILESMAVREVRSAT